MTVTGESSFEGLLVDVVWRSSLAARPVGSLSRTECATRLVSLQRDRSRRAADEVDLLVRMAELSPDDDDLPEGARGAASRE